MIFCTYICSYWNNQELYGCLQIANKTMKYIFILTVHFGFHGLTFVVPLPLPPPPTINLNHLADLFNL